MYVICVFRVLEMFLGNTNKESHIVSTRDVQFSGSGPGSRYQLFYAT